MSLCIDGGWIAANGPCELFTQINIHGLILTECGDLAYIPAACPDVVDEGAIDLGPVKIKIGSVDGSVPDILVQRDSNGVAYASVFELNIGSCDAADRASRLDLHAISVGPLTPDAVQTKLRLRGNGDVAAYGGTTPDSGMGVFEISRTPGVNGTVLYENNGNPGASVGSHYFRNRSDTTFELQELMHLTPTQGILYFASWTYISDERLKDEIVKIDSSQAIKALAGIDPISYVMRSTRHHGFSAQNVRDFLPDAVDETPEGTLTLRDGDLLANLFSATKALLARVEALEAA